MYLQALEHAVPEARFTQPECWEILQRSPFLERLRPGSRALLEKVLLGDSGIDGRYFAERDLQSLFSRDAEALNRRFEDEAPQLAEAAAHKALAACGMRAEDLDALFICTCTGYLCPGLSSHVSERLGLAPEAYLQDCVGAGCGAALPTLRGVGHFLAANPEATAACIAVEVCSAAFYLDDDPGVLISACLFGDGASATIWSNQPDTTGYRIGNFSSLHLPEDRELLRFTNSRGKLRNQLRRSVPEKAASAVRALYDRSGISPDETAFAIHTGGRDVLDAIESAIPCGPLAASRSVLQEYGNISSPSVLLVLERLLASENPPDKVWLSTFGAGFSAHACSVERDAAG
ncbi:MAG: type III polyketide synthase [Opitutales bacterium]